MKKNLIFLVIALFLLESCEKPRCNDGIKNGDEIEVDCGGNCGPCFSCDDEILNNGETLTDCGGYNCEYCVNEWVVSDVELPISAQYSIYKDVEMVSEDIIYSIGGGRVVRTRDGGNTWDSYELPLSTTPDLYKIDFLDENHGVLAGLENATNQYFFAYTVDGGDTWEMEFTKYVSDIQFVDSNTIMGVYTRLSSSRRLIHKFNPYTKNSTTVPNVKSASKFHFFNQNIGIADIVRADNGESGIHKTVDGGQTWVKMSSYTLQELDFVDQNFAYTTGRPNNTHPTQWVFTKDGGQTWNVFQFPFTNNTQVKVVFSDNQTGYVFDEQAKTENTLGYHTTDGGQTWKPFGYYNKERMENYEYVFSSYYDARPYDIFNNHLFVMRANRKMMHLQIK